jgi:hypothetical protein
MRFRQTGNKAALESTLQNKKVFGFFATEDKRQQLFDMDAYEHPLHDPVSKKDIVVGNLVERIKEYVDYLPFAYQYPPHTSDTQVNQALEKLAKNNTNPDTINATLAVTNKIIVTKIENNDSRIDPDLIEAFEWLDMKMGGFVYHLPYERQAVAYGEEWYKNVLLHQELTGSADPVDLAEFEARIKKMRALKSSLDKSDYIRNMTRERQERLRAMYRNDQVNYFHDIFVYVAGLVDIGLMVPLTSRTAETVAGERSRSYHAASVFKAGAGFKHNGD